MPLLDTRIGSICLYNNYSCKQLPNVGVLLFDERLFFRLMSQCQVNSLKKRLEN